MEVIFEKEFYYDLVEHASDLIQAVNSAGEFVYVNRAWKEKLNYNEVELETLRLWDIIHPDSLDHCQQVFQQVIEGCQAVLVEAVFLTKNGEAIPVEGSVNCRLDAEGNVISTRGVFRDISFQKEKELEEQKHESLLKEQINLQKLLSQVTADFSEASLEDFDDRVNQALMLFGEYVSADRAYVFDYDFDRGVCHNTFEWCQEGISPEIDNLQNVPLDMMPGWVETHTAGKTVYIPDVQALDPDDGVRIILEPQGVKSLITLPMMRHNRCEGFIGFDSVKEHHQYTKYEERILRQLSMNIIDATTRVNMTRKLQESEARFRRLFQEVSSIIMQGFQTDGTVSYWNQASEMLFGYSKDEAIEKNIVELIIPSDMKTKVESEISKVSNGERIIFSEERKLKHKNGSLIPVYLSQITLANKNQKSEVFWLGIDLREQKKIEELRAIELEQFRATLLSIGDGVISTNREGKIVIMNDVAEQLTGWSKHEAIGKPIQDVYVRIYENTKKKLGNPADFIFRQGKEYFSDENVMLVSRDGSEISIEEKYALIKPLHGRIVGMVVVMRDVTTKRREEKKIEFFSFRDQLTGLYNRRYIEDAINRLDTNRNLPFAIATLDINVMKLINDAFGHQTGDRLLQTVAEMISQSVRSEDIIGRIGGDEFILLLPRTSASDAEKILTRIVDRASQAKVNNVTVSLAKGYSVKTGEDEEISHVIQQADNQMYMDKITQGKMMQRQMLKSLVTEFHNEYDREKAHAEKVERYAGLIGRGLSLSDREIADLKTAALFHDIGKLVIPPEIYNKTSPLTEEDWQIIKQHPRSGYEMLKNVTDYAGYAEWVLYHHERWDGTGYPLGLMGEEIPLYARIIAVADAFAAMTVDRPFQTSFGIEVAMDELEKHSGSQFDPEIVEVFTLLMGGDGLISE